MPGIQPRLARCKAKALLAVLKLSPHLDFTFLSGIKSLKRTQLTALDFRYLKHLSQTLCCTNIQVYIPALVRRCVQSSFPPLYFDSGQSVGTAQETTWGVGRLKPWLCKARALASVLSLSSLLKPDFKKHQ